jgi:hypothetical protein
MRFLAVLLAATALASAARADVLIPRSVLFGNPSRSGATLSPDGKLLAYLAPRDGVMNVWVAKLGDLADARPVTAEKTRPLREFFFSPDGSKILYLQDKGGTEDFLLYGVDLKTGHETDYTPFKKTRVEIAGASPLVKDRILIGLNNRDPSWHDLYSLDLNTAKLTLLRKGDGYAGFVTDFNLVPRLAEKTNPDGSFTVEKLQKDGTSTKLFDIPFADGLTTSVAGIPKDANFTYVIDSRGRNTAALETMDLTTGKETLVAQDARADIGRPARRTPTPWSICRTHGRHWITPTRRTSIS